MSAAPDGAQRPVLTSSRIMFLAALAALGSLGIHSLIPALPQAAVDLGAAPGSIQLAIGLYLLGLSIGQLFGGWASDLLGRRPLMIAGAALYAAGALAAGLAPGLTLLLGARFVQGAGGACLLAVTRTMVVDLSGQEDSSRKLALLGMISLLSPAFSPLIGGLVTETAGWRFLLLCLGTLGIVGVAGAVFWVRETWTPGADRQGGPFHGFRRLLPNWLFWRFALAGAACTSGLFGFLAASSLVLARQGFDAHHAGFVYLLIACGVVTGALICARRTRQTLRLGSLIYAAGAAMLVLSTALSDTPLALVLPMIVVGVGAGMITPAALAGALSADEKHVGTASSLAGAFQMAAAGITTALAAFLAPALAAPVIPVALAALLLLALLLAQPAGQ